MQLTLSEKAYQHVRSMLTQGQLSPGQRLVTRNLADEIGVSLAPVREALNRLATEGLVEHVPGAGAFVRNPDRQDLEDLYVLREALESCAAAEACRFISDENLKEMGEIVDRWYEMADAISKNGSGHATKEQLNRWLDLEYTFHNILVDASRNRLLSKVIKEYRAISSVFEAQREHPSILTIEVANHTCQSHRELVNALGRRDAEQARLLMNEQIQHGRKTVLSHFSKRPAR